MDIIAHGLLTVINGYKTEVLVNDVPLVQTTVNRQQHTTVHATPWIVNGINELRIVIEQSLLPSGGSSGQPLLGPLSDNSDAVLRASAEIVEGMLGHLPRPGEVKQLASINWVPPTGSEWSLPTILSQNFSLSGRPRWAWQDARPIDLIDPTERARILAFIRDIYDHFAAKRVNALVDCMNSLMSEARHFGAAPTEARESFKRDFWTLAGLPDYEVTPYVEADVYLRPVAQGKVILVQRKDGSPLLQGRAGSAKRGAFPLFLAHLRDGLEVVRTA